MRAWLAIPSRFRLPALVPLVRRQPSTATTGPVLACLRCTRVPAHRAHSCTATAHGAPGIQKSLCPRRARTRGRGGPSSASTAPLRQVGWTWRSQTLRDPSDPDSPRHSLTRQATSPHALGPGIRWSAPFGPRDPLSDGAGGARLPPYPAQLNWNPFLCRELAGLSTVSTSLS